MKPKKEPARVTALRQKYARLQCELLAAKKVAQRIFGNRVVMNHTHNHFVQVATFGPLSDSRKNNLRASAALHTFKATEAAQKAAFAKSDALTKRLHTIAVRIKDHKAKASSSTPHA